MNEQCRKEVDRVSLKTATPCLLIPFLLEWQDMLAPHVFPSCFHFIGCCHSVMYWVFLLLMGEVWENKMLGCCFPLQALVCCNIYLHLSVACGEWVCLHIWSFCIIWEFAFYAWNGDSGCKSHLYFGSSQLVWETFTFVFLDCYMASCQASSIQLHFCPVQIMIIICNCWGGERENTLWLPSNCRAYLLTILSKSIYLKSRM